MRLGELFYMNRTDRKVILLLLLVAGIAFAVLWYSGDDAPPAATPNVPDSSSLRKYDQIPSPATIRRQQPATERHAERFAFDPNTADSTQLKRLGLPAWVVSNIYRYRAAGGVFSRKQDFARIHGLTVGQYRELEPYIRIASDYLPASTLLKETAQQPADATRTPRNPMKLKPGETIDLSTADTTLLQRVPGIGSYYARRIVDYRNRLGGYVNTGQLQEIDHFPTDALPYFTVEASTTQRMRINRLPLDELRRHPYINYYQARSIVDYRRQKGRITDLSELSLLPGFSDEVIGRLRPYVSYE